MTVKDINEIIKIVCPNDEDYEKPCISPKYLRQELEQLALEQEQRYLEQESTTKNDCAEQNGCITCSLDDGDDCCRKLYEESMQEPTPKNDLGVDCIARQDVERYIEGFINEYTPKEELEFINLELDGLKHLPSVTPQEPKIGHWIANAPQYDMFNPQYICSECGNAHTRTTPYCEMCGAKMVEPQESEAEDGNDD